jgi:hypothetical protein
MEPKQVYVVYGHFFSTNDPNWGDDYVHTAPLLRMMGVFEDEEEAKRVAEKLTNQRMGKADYCRVDFFAKR